MSKILIINAGSATLKFKVFSADKLKEEISGLFERIGLKESFLSLKSAGRTVTRKYPAGLADHQLAFTALAEEIKDILPDIKLVGHRLVHGGGVFHRPTKLNQIIIKKLSVYNKLAPLHNHINLSCASAALKILPQARHLAVFDTAYYANLPDYIKHYALSDKFFKLGIRKYGFHGLSHQYAAQAGAKAAGLKISQAKIITCHLGSGASLTATRNGQSCDTTMGFTPLSGLVMSTRSGDLDPFIPLYLIKELKMSVAEVSGLLNHKSGLLGLTGQSDMREILAAAGQKVSGYKANKKFTSQDKKQAQLALAIFVYSVVRYIGQLTAVLGGLDLLVFTGGIGERSPIIRRMIVLQVKHLAKFKTVVIPANEELMMAREIRD